MLPTATDPDIFLYRRGAFYRKNCIPDHRGELCTGGLFLDDTGLFSGGWIWEDQYGIITASADFLPDPIFLAFFKNRTFLYLVRFSGVGDYFRCGRSDFISKGGSFLENAVNEKKYQKEYKVRLK